MCKTRGSFCSLDCQSERPVTQLLVTQLCPVDEACMESVVCFIYLIFLCIYCIRAVHNRVHEYGGHAQDVSSWWVSGPIIYFLSHRIYPIRTFMYVYCIFWFMWSRMISYLRYCFNMQADQAVIVLARIVGLQIECVFLTFVINTQLLTTPGICVTFWHQKGLEVFL